LGLEQVERRLAAILAADVAGYSRLMGENEAGTLGRLKALRRELIDPQIAEHRGRILKVAGDGLLVEFPSAVAAVACAVALQEDLLVRSRNRAGSGPSPSAQEHAVPHFRVSVATLLAGTAERHLMQD
jgi:adenylate cyclase